MQLLPPYCSAEPCTGPHVLCRSPGLLCWATTVSCCLPTSCNRHDGRLLATCHLVHPERASIDTSACLLDCGHGMCVLCAQPASPWTFNNVSPHPCCHKPQCSQPTSCLQIMASAGRTRAARPRWRGALQTTSLATSHLPTRCAGLQQQTCLPCRALIQATAAKACRRDCSGLRQSAGRSLLIPDCM